MMPFSRIFSVFLALSIGVFAASNPLYAQEIFSDGFEGAGNTPGDPEPPQLQGMLAAHNMLRANVDPPASPALTPLVWDAALAQVAQAHANQCQFVHSSNSFGENIAAASAFAQAGSIFNGWGQEADYYNYNSNTCSGSPTGTCGHYTQIVWDDTRRLGCGYRMCTTGSPLPSSSTWHFWVCNYDPPGNVNGRRPY